MPRKPDWIDPRPARNMKRILEALAVEPLTQDELVHRLNISRTTMYTMIKAMKEAPKQVHICGWQRTGGSARPMYAPGDFPDVDFKPIVYEPKKKSDMKEINCKVLIEALAEPKTIDELVEMGNCSECYVRKYIAILLAEKPRRIYVHSWRRPEGKGCVARVFAAGSKKDAKRKSLSTSERFQELMADKEKHDRYNALRRLAAARRRTRKKPHSPFAALGL